MSLPRPSRPWWPSLRGGRPDVRSAAGPIALAVVLLASTPPKAPAQGGQRGGAADTSSDALIPAGYGTLRQDDISLLLKLETVVVRLMPLDESVTRVLAPDSYKSMHDLRASALAQTARDAAQFNLRERNIWLVEYNALVADAVFVPGDLIISAPGRDFRPLRIVPMTKGFGENRLQVRQPQRALYLFDDGMPLDQPLTVTIGAVTNTDWQTVERRIEGERAQVRARAAKAGRGIPPR